MKYNEENYKQKVKQLYNGSLKSLGTLKVYHNQLLLKIDTVL